MSITIDEMIADLATAASVACEEFFGVEYIKEEFDLEVEVGSTLDCEQLPKFLHVLSSGEGLLHSYDVADITMKFEQHNNDVYMVFWDEIIELMEGVIND